MNLIAKLAIACAIVLPALGMVGLGSANAVPISKAGPPSFCIPVGVGCTDMHPG